MTDSFDDVRGDPSVDIRVLVARLWSARLYLLASIFSFAILFVAAALVMTPVYRATTITVPAASDRTNLNSAVNSVLGSLGGFASIAGLNIASSGYNVEETLAVLRSREFTESFIEERNLLPVLFADRWSSEDQGWKGGEEPPTLAEAHEYFDGRIRTVERDTRTGLITVHVDWRDRHQAAEWANILVERINAEMRKRALEQVEASIRYLEAELDNTSVVGTREAINRLMEAQLNQRMLANVTREYALRVVDRALPPDENDPEGPNKLLLFAAGPIVGLMIGSIAVLLFTGFAALPAVSRSEA